MSTLYKLYHTQNNTNLDLIFIYQLMFDDMVPFQFQRRQGGNRGRLYNSSEDGY